MGGNRRYLANDFLLSSYTCFLRGINYSWLLGADRLLLTPPFWQFLAFCCCWPSISCSWFWDFYMPFLSKLWITSLACWLLNLLIDGLLFVLWGAIYIDWLWVMLLLGSVWAIEMLTLACILLSLLLFDPDVFMIWFSSWAFVPELLYWELAFGRFCLGTAR